MASKTEESLSCSLRSILDGLAEGEAIGNSEDFRSVLSDLELFLPAILGEIHGEWKNESLDGIVSAAARKTGPDEAEIIGLCILISDQTLTPIAVRLQVSPSSNELAWLECNVGEHGDEKAGMLRTPYNAMSGKQLAMVAERRNGIDWAYRVGFGQRQPLASPPTANEALA
jgi:hypothetical protein